MVEDIGPDRVVFGPKHWMEYLEPEDKERCQEYFDIIKRRGEEEPGYAEWYAQRQAAAKGERWYHTLWDCIADNPNDPVERAYLKFEVVQNTCGFNICKPGDLDYDV